MNYAALVDANDDVQQVIVIPEGETEAYCTALGLAGTWRHAPVLCAIGQHHHEGEFFSYWFQIPGADTGPDGAESGFPEGFETWHNGKAWVSRVDFNVNEPLDDAATTWSRKDGQYVTPAGWQYQVGEEVQEAGTWYRVKQATSFAPSASPAQYDELTGPGGDVVVPEIAAWVQPATPQDAYNFPDRVTHPNAQDGGNVWIFESAINANTTEPGTDGTFHRWWTPIELA